MKNKLCECGCDQEVKIGNKYIRGHNGHKNPCIGKSLPQLCECGCGEMTKAGNRFIFNHHSSITNLGKHKSEKTKEIIREKRALQVFSEESQIKKSETMINKWKDPEYLEKQLMAKEQKIKKISIKLMGHSTSDETLEKLSIIRTEIWKDPEYKEKQRKAKDKYWCKPNSRQKQSDASKKSLNRPDVKAKLSATRKELWKSPEFAKMMGEAQHIYPNKPETFLLNLLNELYPGEWKYTGDFSFIINGKSPDFTNVNGQKKLIELFGDYWHAGENPQDRKDIFKPFGYETLILWESELKDMDFVLFQLEEFMKEGIHNE